MRPAAHLLLIQNDYDIDFTVIDLPGEREVWATTSSAIDCWSSTMSRESCASIKRVGEGSGFEVMATEDPRTFQKAARSWRPTLIIMDLKMPGVDGIQLLRNLATFKPLSRTLLSTDLADAISS